MLPSLGVITRAQFEPTGLTLAAAVGSFLLTGTTAALKVARKLVAAAGSYAVTGVDATLTKGGKILQAGAGSFALTGTAAALVLSRKIVAEAGAFALTGQTANLNKGQRLVAAAGSYALTGTDAAVKLARKVVAAAGSYALTGTAATLTKSTASLSTVAFQASATASAVTITVPTVQAGDLMVLLDYVRDGAAGLVTPSGWTSIVGFGGTNRKMNASYKIAAGTESGTSITGMNGDVEESKVLLTFRGNVAIASVTAGSVNSQDAGAPAPTNQTVTASGQATPLVIIGAHGADTSDNLTGSTTFDATVGINEITTGYKVSNSSPANHTVAATDGGSGNMLASFYLLLA